MRGYIQNSIEKIYTTIANDGHRMSIIEGDEDKGRTKNLRFLFAVSTRALALLFVCGAFFGGASHAHALTISGTLYSDEGVTAITAPKTIAVAVGTSSPPAIYSTTTNASGVWTVTVGGSLTTTTTILAWVDATSTVRGAVFTIASSTSNNISGLNLFQNRVIISQEGATSTSISDMSFYDNDNDSDIQFNATTSTTGLTINTGNKLYINTGKTFTPLGSVYINGNAGSGTDGSLHVASGATLTTGATTSLAGNLTASSSATIVNYGVFAFTATSTGKTILATQPLGNLAFMGTGSYTFATSATTTNVTINAGATVVAPATTLTITGDYTNSGTFTAGSGTTTFMNNGSLWISRTSAADNNWNSVTYGNGLFVAVSGSGTGNRVMTSPDGINWTSRTSAADNNWRSVTYGLGSGTTTPLFVAVSNSGTGNRVMTSPDGITWTSRTSAADNQWFSVTYGNGLFVAVPYEGGGSDIMTSPDGVTWTSRTSAAPYAWRSVTYGLGSGTTTPLFVAVAENGGTGNRVMTSPDGVNWTIRTSAADNSWESVTYGNGLFVAVSYSGTGNRVMTSPDGINWTSRTSAADNSWYSVTYGNGLFVAVSYSGTGNRVMTSPDGINWTIRTSAADNTWQSVTYGNGLFVAVSLDGTGNRVMTWSTSSPNIGDSKIQTITGIATGTSAFNTLVSTGTSTHVTFLTTLSASTTNLSIQDGEFIIPDNLSVSGVYSNSAQMSAMAGMRTWTSRTSAANNSWYSVTYGLGSGTTTPLFVAVSYDGTNNRVMTSPDGVTWTSRTSSAADNAWQSVTYGLGSGTTTPLFVAVANSGTGNRVMTSPDGITWTSRTSAADNSWQSVTYGNGLFVAVSYSGTGNRVMTSPDGVTWTSRTSAADNNWRSVTYGNGLFVAVSGSGTGNRVMTSPDGITWTSRTSAADNFWSSVTYGNGLFVAVSTTNSAMTSPDGVNWTISTSAASNNWRSVTYGNGLFVAVSLDGTGNRVMTSPDGVTWTSRTSAADNAWYSVTYGNGLFVAVSYSGTGNRVMTSAHGTMTFTGGSSQTVSGTMTGASAFGNVAFTGAGTKTFATNASTSDFTVAIGATVVAPSLLSLSGNYQNNGTTTFGTGTTTFYGTTPQTATGTMTGTSAFSNLTITNTSGTGSSTQSVNFGAPASTTGTLTMLPATSAQFSANATSTFQNINLAGTASQYIYLRSSIPNTRYAFYVPGTQQTVNYVDVKDNSACPTTITVTSGTDAGNNLCWTFASSALMSSGLNQLFGYGQATTSMSTLTITDGTTPTITALNDLRILIATTTVNMRWDTTDTTAVFGGTASGKVSNPVSYLGNGTMLLIPVDTNFSALDTLTIDGLSFAQFNTVTTPATALGVRTAGVGSTTSANDSKTVGINGLLTLANHSAGQVGDNMNSSTETNMTLYAFNLGSAGENANTSALTFRIAGANGITQSDITNTALYYDNNSNQIYDAGDTSTGLTPSWNLTGESGTLGFSGTSIVASTSRNYVLVADIANITVTEGLACRLDSADVTAVGAITNTITKTGLLDYVYHMKGTGAAGLFGGAIGGQAPAGQGIRTGGHHGGGSGGIDPDSGGTPIGNEVHFNAPTSNGAPQGAWTSGADVYGSDGVYAVSDTNGMRHTFGSFGFSVPSDNTITGIEVKIEAHRSTQADTISAKLSWDGGSSLTTLETTGTLTATDAVYVLGSPSDTWGRVWTASELNNGNFTIELIYNQGGPGSAVSVDAIQVNVHYQATGGGAGGGGGGGPGHGAVFNYNPNHYFASVYAGVGDALMNVIKKIFWWLV